MIKSSTQSFVAMKVWCTCLVGITISTCLVPGPSHHVGPKVMREGDLQTQLAECKSPVQVYIST